MRRCIACRQSKAQDELMRFTMHDGEIRADGDRPADGRGFYLCRSEACAEEAIKRKAFNRICRRNVDAEEIKRVIEQAINNG